MTASTISHATGAQTALRRLPALIASALERLADPFALATRVYAAWQFFK